MKTVMVNESFKDRYDSKNVYRAGQTYSLSDERIAEIKEVNPNLITVIGSNKITEDKQETDEIVSRLEAAEIAATAAKAEVAAALEEAEKAKKEAERYKKQLEEAKKASKSETKE